jgi:hypothetical protein
MFVSRQFQCKIHKKPAKVRQKMDGVAHTVTRTIRSLPFFIYLLKEMVHTVLTSANSGHFKNSIANSSQS